MERVVLIWFIVVWSSPRFQTWRNDGEKRRAVVLLRQSWHRLHCKMDWNLLGSSALPPVFVFQVRPKGLCSGWWSDLFFWSFDSFGSPCNRQRPLLCMTGRCSPSSVHPRITSKVTSPLLRSSSPWPPLPLRRPSSRMRRSTSSKNVWRKHLFYSTCTLHPLTTRSDSGQSPRTREMTGQSREGIA